MEHGISFNHSKIETLEKNQNIFLIFLSLVVVLGVVMVYSSSYIYARDIYNNSSHYFYRQLVYIGIGIPVCWVVSKTKVSFWLKYGWFFHLVITLFLACTLIPGVGSQVKGANRWLYFGSLGLQPSEFAKVTTLLVAIPFFENFFKISQKERIAQGIFLLLPIIFLLMQPDFGSFTICLIIIAAACFLSNFPRKYFYSSLGIGILTIIPILISQPYRVRRLFAYLDPWKNPQTSGFQIIQSYLAFANGALFGKGLGNSNEKLFYLPEAHNDFIFSVIGEELGFLGVAFVIFLYIGLIFFGFRLAMRLEKRSSTLLSISIIFTLGLQASLNMGVVLGLLPTKGLNLPFISAGGSSLVANFFAIGLFFSSVSERKKALAEDSGVFESKYQNFQTSPINGQRADNQGNLF